MNDNPARTNLWEVNECLKRSRFKVDRYSYDGKKWVIHKLVPGDKDGFLVVVTLIKDGKSYIHVWDSARKNVLAVFRFSRSTPAGAIVAAARAALKHGWAARIAEASEPRVIQQG